MSYSASKIIKINTRLSASGLNTADFGSALLIINKADLVSVDSMQVDTYRTFSDTAELATLLNTESNSETGKSNSAYLTASAWLGGSPSTGELKIWLRNETDGSWTATLNKVRNLTWWYFTFAPTGALETDANVKEIAKWCEDNESFFFNSQTGANAENIRSETVSSDIATALTSLGYRHCATAVHASDANAGVYLAKHFAVVNYSARNSTITGEFKKSAGLEAEDLPTSEYSAMKQDTKKATFYSVVDLQGSTDQGRWLNTRTHSAYGEWIDDVICLDAFVNFLKVALYNCLGGQVTKLPQTPKGQAVLIAVAKRVCEQFVANGFLGERTYIDPDDGVEKTSRGYEIMTKPEDILLISSADRAERKCAPISIRIFRAGAIHTVDVTVDVY